MAIEATTETNGHHESSIVNSHEPNVYAYKEEISKASESKSAGPANQQSAKDLLDFANIVQQQAAALKAICEDNGYDAPSLSRPFPEGLANTLEASRIKLREAAKAIHDIATGPFDHLFSIAWSYHSVSTLRWLIHFKIPQAIGLHETVSYADLSSKCRVNLSHLKRIMRMCMVNRLFWEPKPDHVAHTMFSVPMITDKVLYGELEFLCEDTWPISTKLIEAHEKWPGSNEASHAAFNAAWNTELPRYPWLHQPGREKEANNFSNMLKFARKERATDTRFVAEGYAWETVETLVDIGGGTGDVAISLIKAFPHLRVIVEDQSHSVELGKSSLPSHLQDRIQLVDSNFFHPRPKETEEVARTRTYLLRMVCHNWSDKDVPRIIGPLLPSLQAGARLLIMEVMAQAPGHLPEPLEWWMRSLDMEMMIEFNSRLRSKEDWERVFSDVDPGLILKSYKTPLGSGLTVMEFGFAR